MINGKLRAIWLVLALSLAACGGLRDDLVIVLPDDDGKVGAVVVDDGSDRQTLNTAYGAVHINPGGRAEAVSVTKADVDQIFGAALAARPIPPRRFRLYFNEASASMTAESEASFEQVFGDIARRPVYEVEVTGHTDTVDSKDLNVRLSLKRALAIKDKLVERGIAAENIVVYGRGEYDLLVKTPDNVWEERNRRVEITVR